MEHLPLVTKPYDPISIPYIGDCEYDGLEFASYPARRGFDLDRLLKGDHQGFSVDAIASFLQIWLYFGFMHELLGVKIQTEDFVRIDDAGGKWVTTQKLPGILHTIRQQVDAERTLPEYTAEYVEQRKQRITECLNLEYHVWEELSRQTTNPLPPEVALSIQVLAITLQVGATQLLIAKNGPGQLAYRKESPWERGLHFRLTRSPFLTARMIKQGWCPIVLDQIRSSCNVVGQYYASLLGPPLRKLDHSSCSKDDKDCNGIRQLPSFKTAHESEDCQCQVLTVDQSKLHAIITDDEIPLLRLVEENGIPALEVISSSSEPGLEYTAMSHVWTDGWGNPNSNSLPLCRVQKLASTIAASYLMADFDLKWPDPENVEYYRHTKHDDRVFFWMDTLCVPRVPEVIHSRAIMQMREVYAQAERVLVFDAELMASTAEASYEELNMRIRCSRWIRRLWTLQEAVLAKRLIFQFAERPHMFMPSSLNWMARKNDLNLNYFNTIGWDCDTIFHLRSNMKEDGLMEYLWKLLICDRAVTVESDEAICGAILMNFDMKELMEAPIFDRMKFFWKLHKDKMPVSILFVPGPRLKEKGYRWAPSSLLPCQKVGIRMHERGTVTEDGLRIKLPSYSCCTVTPLPNRITEAVIPCILDGNKYYVKKSPVKSNPSWEGLELHTRAHLALIIELPARQVDNQWLFDGSRAGLVSVERTESGILYAEYLNLVSIIREGTTFHRFPTHPWTSEELEHGSREPCKGEWIKSESDWCLM